jgi:hypothetical protein
MSSWHETVAMLVLSEAMQQTSPAGQSAASLHSMLVPWQEAPAAWQVSGRPCVDSQQALAGTAHGPASPHATLPGVQSSPPGGGLHDASLSPPAASTPASLPVLPEVLVDTNVADDVVDSEEPLVSVTQQNSEDEELSVEKLVVEPKVSVLSLALKLSEKNPEVSTVELLDDGPASPMPVRTSPLHAARPTAMAAKAPSVSRKTARACTRCRSVFTGSLLSGNNRYGFQDPRHCFSSTPRASNETSARPLGDARSRSSTAVADDSPVHMGVQSVGAFGTGLAHDSMV